MAAVCIVGEEEAGLDPNDFVRFVGSTAPPRLRDRGRGVDVGGHELHVVSIA